MDPIYKLPTKTSALLGMPRLHQMETHGRPVQHYRLRFCDVTAVSIEVARWIQHDWRKNGSPLQKE